MVFLRRFESLPAAVNAKGADAFRLDPHSEAWFFPVVPLALFGALRARRPVLS